MVIKSVSRIFATNGGGDRGCIFCGVYLLTCQVELRQVIQILVVVSLICLALLTPFVDSTSVVTLSVHLNCTSIFQINHAL